MKLWLAKQPTHVEAVVATAVGAVQGAALGGLMGTLTPDGGAPFPVPQLLPGADPKAMASFKQAQVFCDSYLDGGYHVLYAHTSGLQLQSYETLTYERVSVQTCESAPAEQDDFDRLGTKAIYGFVYPNFMINRYGPWMDTNLAVTLDATRCKVVFDYFPDKSLLDDQNFIERSLKDSDQVQNADASIRKRALELVFLLANYTDGKPLIKEFVSCLVVADPDFKKDLAAKIYSTVEKFSQEKLWHLDYMFKVLSLVVLGMGFHITQPGSSVATSLIDGEAKRKHVLLLEIKGNQYRPTKIPLRSVRPFEYAEVVLKDEADVDPNDQAYVLEHLDKNALDLDGLHVLDVFQVYSCLRFHQRRALP